MSAKVILKILISIALLVLIFFMFRDADQRVFGNISIKKKINELQWRIEDLEQRQWHQ